MPPEPNFYLIFTSRLNTQGIRYMVTGAVAAFVYGEPRLTHDLDLVLELGRNEARKILDAFPLEEFYCPPEETIRTEAGRPSRGHFNIIHHETGFRADIYLKGRDELHAWALAHRRSVGFQGSEIWLAPPEYVILRKLEYFREGQSEKHLIDIRGMIELSPHLIDFDLLGKKIAGYGLQKEWEKVRS